MDITVYCVQATDRTRGAIRRDVPKPRQVIDDLAEGTGADALLDDVAHRLQLGKAEGGDPPVGLRAPFEEDLHQRIVGLGPLQLTAGDR